MRKIVISTLSAMLIMSSLVGCTKQAPTEPANDSAASSEVAVNSEVAEQESKADSEKNEEKSDGFDISTIKTFGDVLALEDSGEASLIQSSMLDNMLIRVFTIEGQTYRIRAELEGELYDAVWNLDIAEEQYEDKFAAVAGPIEITKKENMMSLIPSDEDINAIVGKTGKELVDEGWHNWGWNLDEMQFYMDYQGISYQIWFETPENPFDADTFSWDDGSLNDLHVIKAQFEGFGDLSDVSFEGTVVE